MHLLRRSRSFSALALSCALAMGTALVDVPVSAAPLDVSAPSIPTTVAGVGTSDGIVELVWTASTDDIGVDGYAVFENGVEVVTTTDPTVTFGGNAAGEHVYVVTATDAAGNESLASEPATVFVPEPDITGPTRPLAPEVTALARDRVQLDWEDSFDATGVAEYGVFDNGVLVQVVPGTTLIISELALGEHWFSLTVADAVGNTSEASLATPFTVEPPPDTEAPSTPTGVVVTVSAEGVARIEWNAATDNVGVDPPCNSFTAETGVLMADGSVVAIEDVELGDWVLAADPETGELGPRQVTRLIFGSGQKTLVGITVDGATVTATDEHPVWVDSDGEWVDAEDVQVGDVLLTPDGVAVVDAVAVETVASAEVFNLTVDDLHTFYVLVGDTPVLTHNTGGKACPLGAGASNVHPRTGVAIDDDGFPVFDSLHDFQITGELAEASDYRQMSAATRDLNDSLEADPGAWRQFTEAQQEQIRSGSDRIDGFTWHHHQDTERLQLVDRGAHQGTGRRGGRAISGTSR